MIMENNKPSATSSGVAIDEKHGPEHAQPPMAGLSDKEKEIIDRQTTAPTLTVGYFSLFRYAKKADVIIMIVALIASVASGRLLTQPSLVPCHLLSHFNFQSSTKANNDN